MTSPPAPPGPPPPAPTQEPGPSSIGHFFGWVLCIGGGLLLLICGGCTSLFLVMGLQEDAQFAFEALLIGAPGIAVAAAAIWAGRKLLRSS